MKIIILAILVLIIILIFRMLNTKVTDLKLIHILIAILLFKAAKTSKKTYFIRSGELVKIGVSNNVQRRLKQLTTGNGRSMELLGVIPENIEKQLHSLFAQYRVNGEWFKFGPIKNKINQILKEYATKNN